jgi:hypothetical protein
VPTAGDLLLRLCDDAALEAFVAAWRAGTLPKAKWTHAAHVAVCAYHAWPDVALDVLVGQMRTGIRSYNDAVGTANTETSGYHETLTRFWCERVRKRLADTAAGSRLEAVRAVVAALGDQRSLHAAYYDFDVVGSRAARSMWIPPRRMTTQDI